MKTAKKPRAYDNSWLGNMNCYLLSRASCGKVKFTYNGTTKDLTIQAVRAGLKVGDIIKSEYGNYRLVEAAHDDRAGGFWCERIWC